MAEVAASVVAFVQAAEMCTKVAQSLLRKLRAYRHANDRIAELIKTETQIIALISVKDQSNDRLRGFHEECLERLVSKLYAANAAIETFTDAPVDDLSFSQLSINPRPLKKLRYSMFESHLRKTIDDLESWHAVFDPSWFLISLHNDSGIDSALQKNAPTTQIPQDVNIVVVIRNAIQQNQSPSPLGGSVFRSEDFVSRELECLPHSGLAVSTLSSDGARVVIDTTAYPEYVNKSLTTTYVCNLARVLSCSQPETLGLLQCLGVLKKLDSDGGISQYQYIFSIPPRQSTVPASLRDLLLKDPPSLDVKYSIARFLTRGVMAVHSVDFVHKNIRPDTILVLSGPDTRDVRAYLVGFERSRPAAAGTSLTGDMVWERNLYRHPSRQGIRPEHIYIMQHDIYSLGVCLLEIGLWNSLVLPGTTPPRPGPKLQIDEQLAMKNQMKAALDIKKVLIKMARTLLPSLMGLLYTDIVLSCLTCLDPEATNMFAHEKDLYDEDGILVGVVFIEKILSRLESLSF